MGVLEVPVPVLRGQEVSACFVHRVCGAPTHCPARLGSPNTLPLARPCARPRLASAPPLPTQPHHKKQTPTPLRTPPPHSSQVTLHAHTARESGHISGLVSLLNSKSGEVTRAKPRCVLKGQTAVVEVTPARPLCLEDYSDLRALGRVAMRDGGRTVAVGIVTAVTPVE